MSSSHRLPYELNSADLTIEDPGDGGTIVVDRLPGIVVLNLLSSVETRTLADPQRAGQVLTITNPSNACYLAYNTSDTMVLDRADETVVFTSIKNGSSFKWRVIVGPGGDSAATFEGIAGLTNITADEITDDSAVEFGILQGSSAKSLSLAELKKTGVQVANVLQYGADPTGVADSTAAIQNAIDATPTYGGVVYFGPGVYLIGGRITIPPRWYLTICGAGIGPYTDVSIPLTDPSDGSLLYCTSANSGFFMERSASLAHRGIRFHDFAMRSDSSYTADAAFRFDTSGETTFCRQFYWNRIGCTFFKRFILMEDSGSSADRAWGVFRISECTIQNNKQIINSGVCRVNHFVFRNNDAGNNSDATNTYGSGRIHLTGSSVDISNNVIEGCNNPIYLSGVDSGITITNNHFEAITGEFIAHIYHPLTSDITVTPNLWPTTVNSTLADTILIQGSNSSTNTGFRGRINLLGYVHPQNCILSPDNVDNLNFGYSAGSASAEPVSFVTFPVERWGAQPPIAQLDYTHAYDAYVTHPFSDGKIVRGFAPSTSVNIFGTVPYATGEWVFCTWLMKRNDTNTTQHRAKANFTLYSSTTNVTTSRPFYMSYDLSSGQYTPLRKRWTFCCIGWKSTLNGKASDNVRLQLIPYDETTGDSEVTGVVFYALADPSDFRPWIPTKWMNNDGYVTASANDATPSVFGMATIATANTNPTTVTALDDGCKGQTVTIVIGDANTTIDFTGTTLKGNGGVDWTPASGDHMVCTYDGTNWYCIVSEN